MSSCLTRTVQSSKCPQHCAPEKTRRKKTNYTARFNCSVCSQCPRRAECPVKQGKKAYYLRYSRKSYLLACRRAAEKSDAFRERYRLRAGIEATFSDLDRLTGFKRLRYRGLKRVRMSIQLKVLGLNIRRAASWFARIRRNGGEQSGQEKGYWVLACMFFKELMPRILLSFPPLWFVRRDSSSTTVTLAATCQP